MKAVPFIGIILLTLGFLSSVLDLSPFDLGNAGEAQAAETSAVSSQVVEETVGKVAALNGAVINDMLSFAEHPDLGLSDGLLRMDACRPPGAARGYGAGALRRAIGPGSPRHRPSRPQPARTRPRTTRRSRARGLWTGP